MTAAKLVTKVGDRHLAWLAADRVTSAAMRAESEALKAMAAYQVACAFLKLDRLDQAERIAISTAENFLDDSPTGLSVQGALFPIGAVIAGRRSDRPEATERLRRAQYLANALSTDANYGWTAFGPTNGFRIAFAVVNHPALRARLARAVRRDLPGCAIADLTVSNVPARIVAEIKAAAEPLPDAVFIFGLDELGSDQLRSRVIAELNLNRDHLWRAAPVPIVLWASDFAIRQFTQQATDLWSGRSGVYRFRVEGDDNASAIADVVSAINWGSTPDERREREALLHDLLNENGEDVASRARLLVALGDAVSAQHRYDEAHEYYDQALGIQRDIGDRVGEANTLRCLGDIALAQDRYYEARERYDQALGIQRDIGDRLGAAYTLRSLGDNALAQNRLDDTCELGQQALPIQRGIGRPEPQTEESSPSAPPFLAASRGGTGARVFISHASADRELADELQGWLVEAGHEVFLPHGLHHGITVGEEWVQRLHEELRRADVVVCVVTSASLASRWCTVEIASAQSRGIRLLPLTAEPGVTNPLLAGIQATDMTQDRAAARTVLIEALRRIATTGGVGWPDDRSPFPGLRPFEADRHRVFFGRTQEIGQLAGLLRSPSEGAVLVVGPSGCGKSSLVRAGLLPVMDAEPEWSTLRPIVPGPDPVGALAGELADAARQRGLDWTLAHVRDQLEHRGLTKLAEELLVATPGARWRRLLVVVDQLEELLTQTTQTQRARFAALLRPALTGPAQLVATLRPEYLDQFLADPDLARLPTYVYPLRPLRREALRAVIERPAQLAGIRIDDGLADRLVDDTDTGEALPLLAFTLGQLADGVSRDGRLSAGRYDQLGGVQGALTRQADAALDEAVATGGRTREQVIAGLLRLVTVNEQGLPTRWRINRDELPAQVVIELNAFVARRLLTTYTDNGTGTMGVAHEAFLSAWPPLAEAITASGSAPGQRQDSRTQSVPTLSNHQASWVPAHVAHSSPGRRRARHGARGLRFGSEQHSTGVHDRDSVPNRGSGHPGDRHSEPNCRREHPADCRSVPNHTRQTQRGARADVTWCRLVVTMSDLDVALGSALRTRRAVEHAAAEWSDQHRPPSRLWGGGQLAAAVADTGARFRTVDRATIEGPAGPLPKRGLARLLPLRHRVLVTDRVDLSREARTFLQASIRRDQFLRRRTTTVLSILLIIALVSSVVAIVQQRVAQQQQRIATARQLLAQADSARNFDPRTALQLGLAAHRIQPGGETYASLVNTLSTTRYAGTLTGHTDSVSSVAFSPDGHTLATGSADRTVILWDLTDRAQPRPLGSALTGHTDSVWSVAFSPDGHTLATGSADRTVILWDLTDPTRPRRLGRPLTGHTDGVLSVAFSPDGRTLATGSRDNTVRLWDLTDRAQPRPLGSALTGHTDGVLSVAFSPDGHTLATGSADRTVILWDLTDPTRPRRLGRPLTGHTDSVWSMAFSPDGRTLATGSRDNKALLWDLTALNQLRSHAVEQACAVTGGGLNASEWARYIPGLPYQDTCPTA